ncbi:MAG: tRNA preQ1(34) S-adenosylmethionine ribosyltransferase-isomerase QueA [Thermoleophilia bacterium]
MLTSELDYHLPPELIAQHPLVPRDSSRLMVWERASGRLQHRKMRDLPAFLSPGDILAYNESRVLRARVFARKPTGGRVEMLFLRRRQARIWEALLKPSARLSEGMRLEVDTESEPVFELLRRLGEGRWLVRNRSRLATGELLEQVGEMPLPPYIREKLREPERYQTVYAREPGSAAAPTAGLHFTEELISGIKARGVALAPVTLHVGLDTFRPVSEDDLSLHAIHSESYSVPAGSYSAILEAKLRGGRVVAVGTTAVRTLETVFSEPPRPLAGDTDLFITPGFRFRAVDALLTNFHLPRSTLLALVMAFAGEDETRRLYGEAVRERYRFFSFGDAMLLL